MRAIVARADGVPLYAVETVRMLSRTAGCASTVASTRPTGDLADLAVPETLTALIAAGSTRSAPSDRALVPDAAVLGQSFTLAALAAVSGAGSGRARAAPAHARAGASCCRSRPIRARPSAASTPSCRRSSARSPTTRSRGRTARSRHLAAARFFESLGSDELAGALAGHYLAAHQNAPEGPEADALAAQARIALKAAAERAAALGSHEQAVRFLEQALTVTADPADEAELLERAGESASAAAHYESAEAYVGRALTIRRDGGDRVASARATTALARTVLTARQNDRALAILVPAASEFADLAPDPALVGLQAQLARAFMLREDNARAMEIVEPVLEAAEHLDLVPILADALVTKGTALTSMGRLREGVAVIEAGERLARANGLVATAMRGVNNRFVSQKYIDPRACLDDVREGLVLARRTGDRQWVLTLLEKFGHALFLIGEWDTALEAWEEGLEESPEPGDHVTLLSPTILVRAARGEPVAHALAELASIETRVSDPQILWLFVDAPAFAALADGRLAEAGEAMRVGAVRHRLKAHDWLYMAAWTALRLGDADTAAADLAAFDALGLHAPFVDARRSVVEAGLAALRSDATEAGRDYQAALVGFRALGLPFEEALAAIVMATVLDPELPEVRAAAAEARDILTRLGARPFLAALDSALGREPAPQAGSVPRAHA